MWRNSDYISVIGFGFLRHEGKYGGRMRIEEQGVKYSKLKRGAEEKMPDNNVIQNIEETIFAPALQEAAKKAKAEGYQKDEVVLAAANAYANMLMSFAGGKHQVVAFLRKQADALEEQI